MLYILGGAAKSGKSIISRKITQEYGIPFFCIDFVTTMFHGTGNKEINHHTPIIKRADKLWHYTQHLMSHIAAEEERYLIEGDAILPSQVNTLKEKNYKITACFMGYANANPKEKLKMIRKYDHLPDAWTRNFSDEEVIDFIDDRIKFSKYLVKECDKYNLLYIEVGEDLDDVYQKIQNHFHLTRSR